MAHILPFRARLGEEAVLRRLARMSSQEFAQVLRRVGREMELVWEEEGGNPDWTSAEPELLLAWADTVAAQPIPPLTMIKLLDGYERRLLAYALSWDLHIRGLYRHLLQPMLHPRLARYVMMAW